LDKTRFDHGIEIVGEGLDVTGAADFNSAFNVDGAATFTSTVDVTGESTLGRLHYGGTVTNASTTLTIARALTAAEVCDSSVITVNSAAVDATVSAASLDITLPSTTTLWADCLESDGDQVRFWFLNLSPTAATTTQIVAGTGMDLLEPDDSSDHDVEIAGGARALIEITRVDGMETGTLDAIATVVDFSAAD